MKKIYGISIDEVTLDELNEMTEDEKIALVDRTAKENGDEYTIEGFLYYLNNDMIDTENMYWIALNY